MIENINILDCTLRDGGRIINCSFDDGAITGIGKQLKSAGINIIELGFLRNISEYEGNSTFFSSVSDANQYITQICKNNDIKNEKYVLFIDCGLYDIRNLEKHHMPGVSGIRYGFTKKDYYECCERIKEDIYYIKSMGYDIYLQDVNTNGYKKEELIELIRLANEVNPVSFGIVDTYGSMYLEDLEDIWETVDTYLNKNIAVDFHSHNNMQMSFALSQRLIQLSGSRRKIILDSTLNGMGKCAGNLNTELIVDYLTRKYNCDYDVDTVLDTIDRYLFPIKKHIDWGYSIPAFMAGIYRSHPNNVIYLTEKYRLNSKDIKYIISAIDEKTRQRYDYDNIKRIYTEYCANKIDDSNTLERLKELFADKEILVLAPGYTIEKYHNKISRYISENEPIVICVNFTPRKLVYNYLFYANTIHWEKVCDKVNHQLCILTSNIHVSTSEAYVVNYSRLIAEDSVFFDNSTIMLLNLLKIAGAGAIKLAGFDGLKEYTQNYIDDTFPNKSKSMDCKASNKEIKKLIEQYQDKISGKIKMEFLTPSIYVE